MFIVFYILILNFNCKILSCVPKSILLGLKDNVIFLELLLFIDACFSFIFKFLGSSMLEKMALN